MSRDFLLGRDGGATIRGRSGAFLPHTVHKAPLPGSGTRDTGRVRNIRLPLLLVVALLALGASGCGDDSAPESDIPGGADPAAVAVIDDWAMRLADGDIDGAASLFALPSVAENGPTLQLEDEADARLFNASLPCGAELVRATPQDDFIVATFRLIERPGPGRCGAGAGATAQTAFRIEDEEIVEWRRVGPSSEQAPSSSA